MPVCKALQLAGTDYYIITCLPWHHISHHLYCVWCAVNQKCLELKSQKGINYTLSHPENERDVTERAQGYMLQDASFMRQSRCSFLNVSENTQVARAMTSVFVWNTRWRHGRSRGETKYSMIVFALILIVSILSCPFPWLGSKGQLVILKVRYSE